MSASISTTGKWATALGRWPFALCALALSAGCVGIDADVEYPDDDVDVDKFLRSPEGESDPSVSLTEFQFDPSLCEGIDTHPVSQVLNQEDLTRFFAATGLNVGVKKARADLYWYEMPTKEGGTPLRLRLAISKDRNSSAVELHESLLQHGPGWWGLRRSNLAILAPKASLSEAVDFAVKTKLVCWGMFTYTGVDDAYVVRGPYGEL
jgi:hypothetical protein